MDYDSKKVAVIGLAVSNTPLIQYLAEHGANVTVFDKKTAEALEEYMKQLTGLPLEYRLGEDYLTHLHGFDYVFVTPGMKKDLPELKAARAEGAIFGSEMELFLNKCPGQLIGITGSSGKTTTTTLVGKMVTSTFDSAYVGGNIGRSLIKDLPMMTSASKVVLELSSFQLQELKQSLNIAVITNIAPNHLDIHASMDEYIDAKANILRYQQPEDCAILNYDNEITKSLNRLVRGKLYYFSRQHHLPEGAFLDGEKLIIKLNGKEELITTRNRLKLLGDHNVENILTAALAGRLSGVPLVNITKIVEEFTGVEHRLEFVREYNGVKYYNDSISTTPDRAIAGLKAMKQPTILIAGGYDKHIPFDPLAPEILRICKHLVVLGVTAPQIISVVKTINPDFPITKVKSFEDAVHTAVNLATPGEVVLLSPACASYDMFKNYQERGMLFKQIVNEL